ncbi:hypothetical protein [Entomospira culicis]|uniref:Uncharacterized protein n=1 Tax=Entomospira culicis TaxID=2719989 RepID=A0A968GHJ3_9SPIO|nr:hypothetical protein [Entomospira culicis]NIZ18889.1 hypothetical protein [Entomospira culicis]NIZ69104.1 hypothetical protein [Entomospira culicis]WDI37690.1 hypothetical protein PVA46_02600 [Entomospira culicis]WDI39318.1 hypothetical protein PVA47_02605 [Entomospira culicis]
MPFASIVAQEKITAQLLHDWEKTQLAPANLFVGGAFSGKSTTALEVARLILCETKAEQCSCRACLMHRKLMHPRLFLLGNRYFKEEIRASLQTMHAFIQHKKAIPDAVKLLVIQSLRKLIRRFDSALWESDDARYKEAKGLTVALNELLSEKIDTEHEITAENLLMIEQKALEVAEILHHYVINIGQIRSLIHHVGMLSGESRVVIIEEAHLMQESARNALLKILEEPQKELYFILTTTNKQEMLPTILSRLRPYYFQERAPEEQKRIIQKVFRNNEIATLDDLLSPLPLTQARDLANRFFTSAQASKSIYFTYNQEENAILYQQLPAILSQVKERVLQSTLPYPNKRELFLRIDQSYLGARDYNQNPEILLYTLHKEIQRLCRKSEKSLNK